MSEITVAEFKARFGEFASTTDALIQASIDDANLFIPETYLNTKYSKSLQLYLSAHLLSMELNAIAGDMSSFGQITGKTVGNVSATYSVNNTNLSTLMQGINSTSYGQKFNMFLQRARFDTSAVIGVF